MVINFGKHSQIKHFQTDTSVLMVLDLDKGIITASFTLTPAMIDATIRRIQAQENAPTAAVAEQITRLLLDSHRRQFAGTYETVMKALTVFLSVSDYHTIGNYFNRLSQFFAAKSGN